MNCLPPADYEKIKNSKRLAGIFEEPRLPFVKGRIRTTDALTVKQKLLLKHHKSSI